MSTTEKALAPVAETQLPAPRREIRVVEHPIAIFDTARFEHFQRIAAFMSAASLIPEHLRVFRNEKTGKLCKMEDPDAVYDQEGTRGNCLIVINQADRWRLEPFQLAQSTFRTPNGQIGYDGKAVAAALESVYKIALTHEFFGQPGTPQRGIRLKGPHPITGEEKEIEGTVGQWQTKNRDGSIKSNWLNQPDDQLIYRGTRQWCRRHAPGVIMGIVTEDEISEMAEEMRARNASPVQQRIGRASATGFSHEHVTRELDPNTEEQPVTADKPTQPEPSGDEPRTSAAAPVSTGAEPAPAPNEERPAHNSTPQESGENEGGAHVADKGSQTEIDAAEPVGQAGEKPATDSAQPTLGLEAGERTASGNGAANEQGPVGEAAAPEVFKQYNAALFRCSQKKSLKATAKAFWENNTRPTRQTDLDKLARIFALHEQRFDGVDPKEIDAELKKVIS